MHAKQLTVLFVFALFVTSAFSQVIRTVAKNDGNAMFTSVQAAVDASKPGDIIEIIDLETYEEQVTIDSTKGGITIRSSNPLSRSKPVIKWQDVTNRDPLTSSAAQTPGNRTTFEECGALRIIGAMNVTIDGIRISGGGAAPFASPGVWCTRSANGTYGAPCHPLTHGNAAIAIVVAGGVVVRNCDLDSAYFGIAVKDRNNGGVFANPNPGDGDQTVPLGRFGRTGNHLFEHNRIYRNSVGVYFESSWDLGSTVRYNLIYNNFHQPGTVVRQTNNNSITSLSANGMFIGATGADDFGAAAISFKDNLLSPVAIYNNTLYNNHMNFLGNWQVGAQHLLFNNILGKTSLPANQDPNQPQPGYRNLIKNFPNRMHNSVMSTWIDTTLKYQPGVVIPDFAAGSNVRLLQMEGGTAAGHSNLFQSVDPAEDNFLHPDWSNADVQSFIRGQGWAAYGAQGNASDIGAVQHSGRQNTVVRILPADVVMVSGTTAEAKFVVNVESGAFENAAIRAIRWIQPIPANNMGDFGSTATPIPAASIRSVTVPAGTTVNTRGGTNTINFTVPSVVGSGSHYGFFEIVVEGTDANGSRVTSDVGFLPFRTLNHRLRILVLPLDGMTPLTEVTAGEPVRLHITPLEFNPVGVEVPWQGTLDQLALSLLSDPLARLYNSTTHEEFVYTNTLGLGANVFPVYFTTITEETIGGSATAVIQGLKVVFRGVTSIKVNPGSGFWPVTSITGVPSTAIAGTPLTLTGIVNPSHATNKTIAWSIHQAGSTGAEITGGVLTTTGAGALIVRATIADGTAEGDDYTQTFPITVSEPVPDFVPVIGVIDVPRMVKVSEPFTLTGMVYPANATNKTISWSILSAGITGAQLTGNVLNTTETGDIIATATIKNGKGEGVDFEDFFIITVAIEVSVLTPKRDIVKPPADVKPDEFPAVLITSGEFTAGPNPVNRQSGTLNFFWQGRGIKNTKLSIYDASGNLVRKIDISDKTIGKSERRAVGSWDLKDSKGRVVSDGTYVVKGNLTARDGKQEKISLVLGVR